MFRSQIDHHQGGTIFFLTSVNEFYVILLIDVAACLQVTIKINLVINNKCLLCLIHHCIFIYVLNTSGWQTLKKNYLQTVRSSPDFGNH